MEIPNTHGPSDVDSREVPEDIVRKALQWYDELDPKYEMNENSVNIGSATQIGDWSISAEFFGSGEDELGFRKSDEDFVLAEIETIRNLVN